jgi:hypothetical protein
MMPVVKAMSVKNLLFISKLPKFNLPIPIANLRKLKMKSLASFQKLGKLLKINMLHHIQRKEFSSRVILSIR